MLAAANGANAKLQQLIGEAARTANGDGLCHGGAILIPRRPPAQPLSLIVSPLRAEGANRIAPGGADSQPFSFLPTIPISIQKFQAHCCNSSIA